MLEEDDSDLEMEPVDAGLIFRAEMWATNAFMGYWKHLLAFLIVMLLAVLFFGQYRSWYQNHQRDASHGIFEIEQGLNRTATEVEFAAAADELAALATTATGTAKAESQLKAVELYRNAGDTARQREVLNDMIAADLEGVLGFAARSAMASLEMEEDNQEAAVEHLTWLYQNADSFLSEQAGMDLGVLYEHQKQVGEARALYTDMLALMEDGPRREMVEERLAGLPENTP